MLPTTFSFAIKPVIASVASCQTAKPTIGTIKDACCLEHTLSEKGFEKIDRDYLTYRYSYRYTDRDLSKKEKLELEENCIAKVISRGDLLGATNQMLKSFENVILYINIFSVVVYIVILYIMTKVVIEKNALSISYMKVFGYHPGEIRKLYLTATTIVVLVSLVVYIPL